MAGSHKPMSQSLARGDEWSSTTVQSCKGVVAPLLPTAGAEAWRAQMTMRFGPQLEACVFAQQRQDLQALLAHAWRSRISLAAAPHRTTKQHTWAGHPLGQQAQAAAAATP